MRLAPYARSLAGHQAPSPRPTDPTVAFNPQATSPKTTAAPSVDPELIRRVAKDESSSWWANTCGAISPHTDLFVYCTNFGSICTSQGAYVGCCIGTGSTCSTQIPTTCAEYAKASGKCSGSQTMCCNKERPHCVTYQRAASGQTGDVGTMFQCDTTTGAGILLNYADIITSSTSSTSTPTSHTDAVPTTSSLSAFVAPLSTSPSSSASSTTALFDPLSTDPFHAFPGMTFSPPNAAAIAGGIVGALAVVGLIIVGVLYMQVKKRRVERDIIITNSLAPRGHRPYPSNSKSSGKSSPTFDTPYDNKDSEKAASPVQNPSKPLFVLPKLGFSKGNGEAPQSPVAIPDRKAAQLLGYPMPTSPRSPRSPTPPRPQTSPGSEVTRKASAERLFVRRGSTASGFGTSIIPEEEGEGQLPPVAEEKR